MVVGSEVVGEAVGEMVGADVVGDTVGEVVGVDVIGDTVGEMVGFELIGEVVGDAVGLEVVGEVVGDAVGPEVVGEMVGDAVGVEVVGDIVGERVTPQQVALHSVYIWCALSQVRALLQSAPAASGAHRGQIARRSAVRCWEKGKPRAGNHPSSGHAMLDDSKPRVVFRMAPMVVVSRLPPTPTGRIVAPWREMSLASSMPMCSPGVRLAVARPSDISTTNVLTSMRTPPRSPLTARSATSMYVNPPSYVADTASQ